MQHSCKCVQCTYITYSGYSVTVYTEIFSFHESSIILTLVSVYVGFTRVSFEYTYTYIYMYILALMTTIYTTHYIGYIRNDLCPHDIPYRYFCIWVPEYCMHYSQSAIWKSRDQLASWLRHRCSRSHEFCSFIISVQV